VGKASIPFDIEPEYLDPIVVLSLYGLLSGIELLPFINVLATGIASPACKLATQRNKNREAVLAWRRAPSIEQPVASCVDRISLE
jgi:hypothetical protein